MWSRGCGKIADGRKASRTTQIDGDDLLEISGLANLEVSREDSADRLE